MTKEDNKIGDTFQVFQFQNTFSGICLSTMIVATNLSDACPVIRYYQIIQSKNGLFCSADYDKLSITRVVLTEKTLKTITEAEAYDAFFTRRKSAYEDSIRNDTDMHYLRRPKLSILNPELGVIMAPPAGTGKTFL